MKWLRRTLRNSHYFFRSITETIRYQLKNFKSIPPIEPSCKKTLYNSKAEAEDMIRYIRENRVVRELRAYQCTICGKWHLTSKSEQVFDM